MALAELKLTATYKCCLLLMTIAYCFMTSPRLTPMTTALECVPSTVIGKLKTPALILIMKMAAGWEITARTKLLVAVLTSQQVADKMVENG